MDVVGLYLARNLFVPGAISDVKVMTDEEKKSRGFGFISFEEYSSAQACLKQRFVDICGKQVFPPGVGSRSGVNFSGG